MTTARMPSCTLAAASVFYVRSGSLACGHFFDKACGDAEVRQRILEPMCAVVSRSPRVHESKSPAVEPAAAKQRPQLPLSLSLQQNGSGPTVHPHRHPVAARKAKVSKGRQGPLQQ